MLYRKYVIHGKRIVLNTLSETFFVSSIVVQGPDGEIFGVNIHVTATSARCHPNILEFPSRANFVYICVSEDFRGHSECYLSPRGSVSELHKWNKWSGEKGWKGAHKYNKYTNTQIQQKHKHSNTLNTKNTQILKYNKNTHIH